MTPSTTAALIKAAREVLIGGNHVALLIGSNHPLYTASDEVAQSFYLPHHPDKYEAWLCWRAIMRLREALAAIEAQQQPTGGGEEYEAVDRVAKGGSYAVGSSHTSGSNPAPLRSDDVLDIIQQCAAKMQERENQRIDGDKPDWFKGYRAACDNIVGHIAALYLSKQPDTRHERACEVLREGLVIADELLEGLGARLPYVECAKIKDTLARADAILKGEE